MRECQGSSMHLTSGSLGRVTIYGAGFNLLQGEPSPPALGSGDYELLSPSRRGSIADVRSIAAWARNLLKRALRISGV